MRLAKFGVLKNLIVAAGLVLLATSPAHAQFNAFKDPVAPSNGKIVDTEFVAVEKEIKGGKIAAGQTASFVVVFTNRTPTPITVKNVNLYPSSTVTAAIALNQCADFPLAKNSQCAVTVSVTGKQVGGWRVDMLLEHNGDSRITTSSISGEVESGNANEKVEVKEISVSDKLIDFGKSGGGLPISKPVILTNSSGDSINILGVSMDVSDQSGFSYKSLCHEVLQPYASCSIILNWEPKTKGVAQGVLTINHTGRSGSSTVEFTGEYVPEKVGDDKTDGEVSFSSPTLDFGDSDGGLALSRAVVLSNKTLSSINISEIKLDAANRAGLGYLSKCPIELKPHSSCVIILNWEPTTVGKTQGVLTVTHSGKGGMSNVEIKGNYAPAKGDTNKDAIKGVTVFPADIDFGSSKDDVEKVMPITITNNSGAVVNIKNMGVKAAAVSGLTYESQCAADLQSGESCSVLARWKPQAKGDVVGVFFLTHSGLGGSNSVKIKAQYSPTVEQEVNKSEGSVLVSPMALDFGTTDINTASSRPVIISNKTFNPISVTSVSVDAPEHAGFSYINKCPLQLAPGSNCAIIATWKPDAKGVAQGVLTINHSGKEASASIEMKGSYNPPVIDSKTSGKVEISPNALDFGSSSDNIELSRSVVLTNSTDSPITISGTTIDASDKAGFSYSTKCPQILPSGGNCAIIVKWKPNTKGTAQGVLTVNHSGKAMIANLEMKGIYTPAETPKVEEGKVEIAPNALDFGSAEDNMAMSRSVVLANNSNSAINISGINLDAPEHSGYSYVSKCPLSLPAGGTCGIVVTWKPNTKGAAQGVLTVNHSGKSLMANLEMKGVYNPPSNEKVAEGKVVISPASLDFGASVESLPMSRSVTLSNESHDSVAINSINIDAPAKSGFSQSSKCPLQLTAGSSCVIVITWTPAEKGAAQGVLTINHSGKEAMASMEMKGVYTPPAGEQVVSGKVELSPDALDFGAVTSNNSTSRLITFSNKTLAPINVSSINIDAPEGSGFSYASKCPLSLPSAGNCTIVVTWKPNNKGAAQGVLTINHSGKEGMSSLEMKGLYTPEEKAQDVEGKVEVSPTSLDFGATSSDVAMTRSLVLANNTKSDIAVGDISIDSSANSGYTYKSKCQPILKSGGQCVLVLTWKPTEKGDIKGVLTINHSGKSGMSTVELMAKYSELDKGVDTDSIALSPTSIDFGASTGGITMSRSLLLTNKSNANVDLKSFDLSASEKSGFSYTSKCPAQLVSGAKCTIILSWNPTSDGLAQGVFDITHTGKEGTSSIEIKGLKNTQASDKNAGSVSLSPSDLDFGSVTGGIEMTRPVVFSNNTMDKIKILDVGIDAVDKAGFSIKNKCPEELLGGSSCVVTVSWKPTSIGLAQGVISIAHSGKQNVASMEVRGKLEAGQVGSAKIYPNSSPNEGLLISDREEIDFGEDISDTSTIVVSLINNGYADLHITDLNLSGLDNGVYLSKGGCDKETLLRPGSGCALALNWLPKRTGLLKDSLQIRHTGSRGILVIPIKGKASGVSKETLDKEREKTGEAEMGSFYEDYYYENLAKNNANLTAKLEKIDKTLEENNQVTLSTDRKKRVQSVKITSLSIDRAVLLRNDNISVIVRDGDRIKIEELDWDVAILKNGVLLHNELAQISLGFDRALVPGTNNVESKNKKTTTANGVNGSAPENAIKSLLDNVTNAGKSPQTTPPAMAPTSADTNASSSGSSSTKKIINQ